LITTTGTGHGWKVIREYSYSVSLMSLIK